MKSMQVELAFFDLDDLLCQTTVIIIPEELQKEIICERGEIFQLTYQFELPACPVFIKCFKDGEMLFQSAMRMGVHDSEDWEATSLAEPYELCFKCTVMD